MLSLANVKYAIIDISFGGYKIINDEKIRYTGVDVLEMIQKYNPDIKFILYTNNHLNPGIKANKSVLDKYEDIRTDNIHDHVLYKTALTIEDRREYFVDNLFS